jgi:D-arabinose 1-dehydrogenase-like Zn-dependent alcohol dehydrogenase
MMGLFGNLVKIPVAPMVIIEYTICGSLCGDYNELREFIELQNQEKNK